MNSALILNLDSDTARRERRSAKLEEMGFPTVEAGAGEEALALAIARSPDVILLSGVDPGVVHALQELPETPGLVLLLPLSSFPDPAFLVDAYHVEAAGDRALLNAHIRAAIRARDVRRLLRGDTARIDRLVKEKEALQGDMHKWVMRASHDLHEPIRAFQVFLMMLDAAGGEPLGVREQECAEQISYSLDRLRRMFQYMLSYAQLAREQDRPYSPVRARLAVSAALANLSVEIQATGSNVNVHGDLPAVRMPLGRLQELFHGLIANAIKYRKPGAGAEVEISAEPIEDNQWEFSVKDHGIGIAPEYHESIFEPFLRLHGKEIPGAGLGLTLSRKIAETFGGSLSVKSTPDRGADFRLKVPGS